MPARPSKPAITVEDMTDGSFDVYVVHDLVCEECGGKGTCLYATTHPNDPYDRGMRGDCDVCGGEGHLEKENHDCPDCLRAVAMGRAVIAGLKGLQKPPFDPEVSHVG